MNRVQAIVSRFGSQTAMAEALSIKQSTVQYWTKSGRIPEKWHEKIVAVGREGGLFISVSDLIPPARRGRKNAPSSIERVIDHTDISNGENDHSQDHGALLASPFAKWRGQIDLGGDVLDCYVLDTEQRVIALRSAIKSIAGTDSGKLGNYIGVSSLKPFLDSDLVLGELVEFSIPGTQFRGSGMTTEHFEMICRGYVRALYENAPLTERQREIAIKCAVLTSGLTRTGLDALIDEATGYQYERAEDALQVKLRAFIAEELRAWEKTFPDELWEEFGRLTNWRGSLTSRPKYWGKLVIELVYDTLDPDVAAYLRSNRPPAGIKWHQNLTENYGIRQLVSRCYEIVGLSKSCKSMAELRKKVSHHYGKQAMLFNVYDEN